MRNIFKIASSVGAAALLISGAAVAGPPEPFGNWTVNPAGNIVDKTAACPGGVTGKGFEQCDIVIGGQRYIRTRIADDTFKSEDFVRIGGGGSGLASTMAITDTTTDVGTTFGTTADIMTGWAVSNATTSATPNKSEAVLGLTLNTVATSATAFDAFDATFGVTSVTPSTGPNKISALNVGQTVQMGTATDKQRFELKNVGSDQVVWTSQSVANVGDFSNTQSRIGTPPVNKKKTNLGASAVDTTVWTSVFGEAPSF